MKTPHLTTLDQAPTPQAAENFRTLLTNANPASSYLPANSRDEVLVKCKKAIENLHFEVDKQKQTNLELLSQVQQYDQLVTQLQDDQISLEHQLQ